MWELAAAGILSRILETFDNPRDLLSFSIVCQSWRSASANVCPKKLILQRRDLMDYYKAGIGRGLVALLRQDRLRQLSELQLLATNMSLMEGDRSLTEEGMTLQHLSATIFTTFSMCSLRVCHIEGTFCLRSIVELLPSSLEELHLCLDYDQQTFPLSSDILCSSQFQRFSNLQKLCFYSLIHQTPLNIFSVDCAMPSLKVLELPGAVLSLPQDCTVPGCLPSLTEVVADIDIEPSTQFEPRVQGLLQSVCQVNLQLHYIYGAHQVNFIVQESSALKACRLQVDAEDEDQSSINLVIRKVVMTKFSGPNLNVQWVGVARHDLPS